MKGAIRDGDGDGVCGAGQVTLEDGDERGGGMQHELPSGAHFEAPLGARIPEGLQPRR